MGVERFNTAKIKFLVKAQTTRGLVTQWTEQACDNAQQPNVYFLKSPYKRRCTDLTDLGLLEKTITTVVQGRKGRGSGCVWGGDKCCQGNTAFELNMPITVIEEWSVWRNELHQHASLHAAVSLMRKEVQKTNNALWVCALGTYSTLLFCVWACLLSSSILYPCTAHWDCLLSCFVCQCLLCVCVGVYVTPSLWICPSFVLPLWGTAAEKYC